LFLLGLESRELRGKYESAEDEISQERGGGRFVQPPDANPDQLLRGFFLAEGHRNVRAIILRAHNDPHAATGVLTGD
jgi:hypothetical protein